MKIKKNIMDMSKIQPIDIVFEKNTIPISFSSSDFFAPYLGVTIQSIIDKSSSDYNYDLVVFTKDMSDFNKQVLSSMCNLPNFSIRFINVKEIFDALNLYTPGHITIETYFRLIIPVFMKNYSKILFLDSDLLILEDVKNLYQIDLGDNAIGAAEECLMSALLGIHGDSAIDYMYDTLHLKNPDLYFQAGVMIMNIDYFNQHDCCKRLMNMVCNFNYNIVDQDAMNELLNDKCLWIPNEWNYPPLQKHMKKLKYIENMSDFIREKYLAVKHPKILHFADCEKPWWDPSEDYAPLWWAYAKKTPYYELIIKNMMNHSINEQLNQNNLLTNLKFRAVNKYSFNCINYWKCKLLRNLTFGKTREHYIEKKYRLKNLIRLAEECK